MKNARISRHDGWVVACIASMVLAGCGGSSSDSGTTPPSPPPPTTSGPIVRIGLVFAPVADGGWYLLDAQPELYIPSDTDVKIDGVSTSPVGLSMDESEVIRIAGTTGFKNNFEIITAAHIRITHMLDGPVDAVDPDHGTMIVLGQTVVGTADFKVGDRVSVSGHPSAAGQVVSTRIAASTRAGDFLASGIARSADAAKKQFQLNEIVVDYSTAQLLDLPTGAPGEGERVLVWGTRAPGSNTLTASSVADDSGLLGEAGASVSMHGIVTSVESASSFTVDGFAATTALGGNYKAMPIVNANVTMGGTITSGDTTAVSSLDFTVASPDPFGFVQGPIDSIDATFGTLGILGFKIQPNITTHIVDIQGTPIPLTALKAGDVVIAGGSAPTGGTMFANSIGQFSANTFSMIRAFDHYVTLAQPIVYLYGRAITTDANTLYYWVNNSNHAITPLSDPSVFWSGSRNWPFWDKICRPSVAITVVPQTDGSLLGTAIVIEPDYC